VRSVGGKFWGAEGRKVGNFHPEDIAKLGRLEHNIQLESDCLEKRFLDTTLLNKDNTFSH